MNKKNQILTVIIVVIVGFVVFVYFKNSSKDNSGSTIVAEQRVAEFAGAREILSLLNKMANVKLDDSIFNDGSFISLKDTTVILVAQPINRDNPFAPIGTDGPVSSQSPVVSPSTRSQSGVTPTVSPAVKTQAVPTPFGGGMDVPQR
jgi:hypothetical protein